MSDVLAVQVMEAGRHLTKPKTRLLLWYHAIVLYEVEQIAVVGIAHEDKDAWTALQDTVHLHPPTDQCDSI